MPFNQIKPTQSDKTYNRLVSISLSKQPFQKFKNNLVSLLYIVLVSEESFRPCLTGCDKKAEVGIPPYWVQLDNVVVVIHEYLRKQIE